MKHIKIISVFFILLIAGISCKSNKNILTEKEAQSLCDKLEMMYNHADTTIAKEILAPDYIQYSPFFPSGLKGIDVLLYNIKSNGRSFPDFILTIDSFFVKDNAVYSFWTRTGTNTGLLGRMPSTGKSIDVSGVAISEVRNGKIYEEHMYWNALEFYKQLGFRIVPPFIKE